MGVRATSVFSNTIVNVTIVLNAETVVVSSPPINQPLDGAQVLIYSYAIITTGAGTTGALLKLRRGTTTAGAVVNAYTSTISATVQTIPYLQIYADSPGIVAALQYSFTFQTTLATANHTVLDASIVVMVL